MYNEEPKLMKWIKLNIFSIFTALAVVCSTIIYLGNIPTRLLAAENQISINTTRLTVLEKSLSNYIATNTADHDIIRIQLTGVGENVHKILDNIIDKGMSK